MTTAHQPNQSGESTSHWLDRRLVLFTGKGGVGKSTVAAATALLAAEQGKRVLLIDVDSTGNLAALFEHPEVGFIPTEIYPGISAMQMETEDSLREYLNLQLRLPLAGRVGPLANAFDFIASAAPGVKEILTMGKICWEVRESLEKRAPWDIVIVDAAATGHVISQLDSPRAIRELVKVGPVANQTEWVIEMLADPLITELHIVTTPEEMPVSETIDLVKSLKTRVDVPLGNIIVNRVLPEPFNRADADIFSNLETTNSLAAIEKTAGLGGEKVLAAASLAVSLRRSQSKHIAYLRQSVDLPLVYLPYLFIRDHGLRVTRVVSEALGYEMGTGG